jgi:hypothetical protein
MAVAYTPQVNFFHERLNWSFLSLLYSNREVKIGDKEV